jgi:hypothetical protein
MIKPSIYVTILAMSFSAYTTANQTPTPEPPRHPLASDGIHDPNSSVIGKLQEPVESMQDFPKDRRGEVDWVQTIQKGLITPRKTIDGQDNISSMLEQDYRWPGQY